MGVTGQRLESDPNQLREWANSHDRAAEAIAAARQDQAQALDAARSWGPLFYEAQRATADAVAKRDAALQHQGQRHTAMADQLRATADHFEQMDAANRQSLTISTED